MKHVLLVSFACYLLRCYRFGRQPFVTVSRIQYDSRLGCIAEIYRIRLILGTELINIGKYGCICKLKNRTFDIVLEIICVYVFLGAEIHCKT